jgi:hypothetical protein
VNRQVPVCERDDDVEDGGDDANTNASGVLQPTTRSLGTVGFLGGIGGTGDPRSLLVVAYRVSGLEIMNKETDVMSL